jgi:bifunctional ADP-heptose synthase (sugar kinase/adenylyltransferase)
VAAARRLRLEGMSLKMVTGCFDPLLAGHARRLEELKGGAGALMVVVTEPQQPILSARARAELVAALATVDYVVPSVDGRLEELVAQLREAVASYADADDEQLTRDMIRHVYSRHSAA